MRLQPQSPLPRAVRFLLYVLPPGPEGLSIAGDLLEECEIGRRTLGEDEAGKRLRREARRLAFAWTWYRVRSALGRAPASGFHDFSNDPGRGGGGGGGGDVLEQLRSDVGFALRTFVRHRGFTAVALMVLALGIGAEPVNDNGTLYGIN